MNNHHKIKSNSDSLSTISCYQKIPKICSSFKICYLKYSLEVGFSGYSDSGSNFPGLFCAGASVRGRKRARKKDGFVAGQIVS
jgi:hypothetical protein